MSSSYFGLYSILSNGDELLVASSDQPYKLIDLLVRKGFCKRMKGHPRVCQELLDGFLSDVDITNDYRISFIEKKFVLH